MGFMNLISFLFPFSVSYDVHYFSAASCDNFSNWKCKPCNIKAYLRKKPEYRDKADYLTHDCKKNTLHRLSDSLKENRKNK